MTLHVRVTPNAGVNRIDGREVRDDGTAILRVRVTAVPDKGKANTSVTDLLAKALAVPKTAVLLVQGQTARLKTFEIAGDPAALAARIDSLG